MASVNLSRGGTPDFKGWFCEGQFAEFNPPYDAPNMPGTPPWDSHADAAYGQGYLNLHFPLVPNLEDTRAHAWMQHGLRKVKSVGDIIWTNWVPMWSYVDSLAVVVKTTDALLDGVTVTPTASRIAWDFATEEWVETPVTAFTDAMTAANMGPFVLGTPGTTDKLYGVARLGDSAMSATFGHPLVKRDATGKATGPLDAQFGVVRLGLKISAGDTDRISAIWRSSIAVYLSAKLLAFEGASQVG